MYFQFTKDNSDFKQSVSFVVGRNRVSIVSSSIEGFSAGQDFLESSFNILRSSSLSIVTGYNGVKHYAEFFVGTTQKRDNIVKALNAQINKRALPWV